MRLMPLLLAALFIGTWAATTAEAQSGPPATFAGFLKGWDAPRTVEAFATTPDGTRVHSAVVEAHPRGWVYRVAVPSSTGNLSFRVDGLWAREYAFLAPGLTATLNLTLNTPPTSPPEVAQVVLEGRVPTNLTEPVRVHHDGAVVAEAQPVDGSYRVVLPAWMARVNVTAGSTTRHVEMQAGRQTIDLAPTEALDVPPTAARSATPGVTAGALLLVGVAVAFAVRRRA